MRGQGSRAARGLGSRAARGQSSRRHGDGALGGAGTVLADVQTSKEEAERRHAAEKEEAERRHAAELAELRAELHATRAQLEERRGGGTTVAPDSSAVRRSRPTPRHHGRVSKSLSLIHI